jgi:hypothetical protein
MMAGLDSRDACFNSDFRISFIDLALALCCNANVV